MSRTNHHRRYRRWNIEEPYFAYWHHRDAKWEWETHTTGMQIWDLRFYAGCRRRPQVIHRVLDFHGLYAWRVHHGRDGVAKSYGDIREGQFRTATRRYVDEARLTYNAGGEVDEISEPDNRPRSIEWDLW